MIDERRERDPNLSYDLRPQMQGVAGVAPGGQWQVWPCRILPHGSIGFREG